MGDGVSCLSRWRAVLGMGDILVLFLLDHAHLPAHRCTHPAQVMITAGTPLPIHLPRPPSAPTRPPSTWRVGIWGLAWDGWQSLCPLTSLCPSLQMAACTPQQNSGVPQGRRALGPCWVGAHPPCPSRQAAVALWAAAVVALVAFTSTSAW